MATRIPALIQLSDPRVAAQLVYTKSMSDQFLFYVIDAMRQSSRGLINAASTLVGGRPKLVISTKLMMGD